MGPTCEVLLERDDDSTPESIDELLANLAEKINRTRKGRVWNVWVRGRPVHVQVLTSPSSVSLSAGCKASEDYDVLRDIARQIADRLGGVASEVEK